MRGQKLLAVLVAGMFLLVCLGCGKDKERKARNAAESITETNILGNISNRITVDGSGNIVEENRDVSDFTGLALSGFGNVIIDVGDVEALRVEADDNLMEYFETEVRNGTLGIGIQSGVNVKPTQPVRFYATVKGLDKIVLSGSGNIEAPDLEAERFSLTISGSGNAKMGALNARALDVTISGSGNAIMGALNAKTLGVTIGGSGKMSIAGGHVEEQSIVISGSGKYDAGSLRSESAKTRISGSGNVTLWATESLDAHASGSGSVGYYGEPRVSFSGSGSGKARSLGEPQ
jgi:hypothetical protein